jgi:hypothetical protein
MRYPVIATATLAAASMVVGVSVIGCSKKSSTSPSTASSTSTSSTTTSSSSSSSAAAQPTDYSLLLIKATDINVPGDTFTAQPLVMNPGGNPGVAGAFVNQAGTRNLGDTILVMTDANAAAGALDGTKANFAKDVAGGGNPQPADVGTGGTMFSGTSTDGSKSMTALVFTEGKTIVTMEFDGAPNDPVPSDIVNDVGQKQDAAIKASGLS